MEKEKGTYLREKYDFTKSFENDYVALLYQKLEDMWEERKKVVNEIKEAQNRCDHKFYFVSHGPAKDSYICSKCGYETEL